MAESLHKESKVIEDISAKFKIAGKVQRERRVWVTIDKDNLIMLCNFVKDWDLSIFRQFL